MPTNPSITSYRSRLLRGLRALSAAGLLMLAGQAPLAFAQMPPRAPHADPAPAYDPLTPPAFAEAERAMAGFKKPVDLKSTVWAAEPQLNNPVLINVDNRGRIWVSETNRFRNGGVMDIRKIFGWLEEDLACRSVDDRIAMTKRNWPDSWQELTKNPDRIRLLEDSSGGGKCDKAVIWADGFNDLADGIGAGTLFHKGTVYYCNIPNLWVLRDNKGTGVSDERKVLSTGYGIRYSFEGHDLHGPRIGPDGKLYVSVGDRAFSVKTQEGKLLDNPDHGGVLRCDLDGSNLEIFCNGLRNPQDLCFDEHGNLFTGDNNADHGDPAKWYYLVEGADCGWRIGYQHLTKPRATGALLMESIMAKAGDTTLYYNTPPIEHIGNGPSGCASYPGTGMPASFNGHFLMCDFKGGNTNSGIWTFTMKPHGATFDMDNKKEFVWRILATDAQFGTDGGFYASDWVNGWERSNKGRIYHFFDEAVSKSPLVAETKKLLFDGFEQRGDAELIGLLSHADQRVRTEAQLELADRGDKSIPLFAAVLAKTAPKGAFDSSRPDLAPLHAIWGLGRLARKNPAAVKPVIPMLSNADEEVRAQALKIVGESHAAAAFDAVVGLLKDEKPRVRFFAAMAAGKLANKDAVPAILDLLAANADADGYIRHACVMALVWINDEKAVLAAANSPNASVRMGVVEVLRRWAKPEIAQFLADKDPKIVLEAARAINDVPIEPARAALAKLIDQHKLAEPILRRAINSHFRLGGAANAAAVAQFAAGSDVPEALRIEALEALGEWEQPSLRDHIMGLVWPLPDKTRDPKLAAEALRPMLPGMLHDTPDPVRTAALGLAERFGVDSLDSVFDLVGDANASGGVRAAALKLLAARKSPRLGEAMKIGLLSKIPALRKESILLQTTQPDAVTRLEAILADASPTDQQAVFTALPMVGGEAVDTILANWMAKLIDGKVAPMAQLDLLTAASRSKSKDVQAALEKFNASRSKTDTLAEWRECIEGGDAAAGRKVFLEKAEVGCIRCHMIGNEVGGNVGPNLVDIGKRQNREYILESIMLPNAKIAPGFESASIKLKDGRFLTGVVKSEDETGLRLDTGEELGLVSIKKSEITTRKAAPSPMPEDISKPLSKEELRNLVEFLANRKGPE